MGAILTHPLSEEGSQAQVWALRILGGGQRKLVGLKIEAKKRTRNGFKVTELWD